MLTLLTNIPNYDEELKRLSKFEDSNVFDKFVKALNDLFGIRLPEGLANFLVSLLWVFFIALILWVIYKEFVLPELNAKSKSFDYDVPTGGLQGTAEDADIRGHNFATELDKALAEKDYALAVRLRYLMTLEMLNDAKLITWTDWKTPLMYVAELKEGSEILQQITMTFLYIKYGHYPATEEVYEEVVAEYQQLTDKAKGGEA